MTEPAFDLTQVADGVIVRDMLTISRAIDAFLADGIARGWPENTTVRTYRRTLDRFADFLPPDTDVAKITGDDIRQFRALRQRRGLSASTIANEESQIASLLAWLVDNGKIRTNPMRGIQRTKRPKPEDIDVISNSVPDVLAMLDAAKNVDDEPEGTRARWENATGIAAYLGARRSAIARLKDDDYRPEIGKMRFREKGKKTIWKLVPPELAVILERNREAIWPAPNNYLVPPLRSISAKERDATVIWTIIKDVARAAGVESTVHSLRRAFACFYLEQNPGDIVGLSEALGHESVVMSMVYLRRLERDVRMEPLRRLSWQNARPNGSAQPSRLHATSLTGERSTIGSATETRLRGDAVTMRSPRQLSDDGLVSDLNERLTEPKTDVLGALAAGVREFV